MEQYDYLFKIIIIGDSAVGKTSMLYRFCDDKFNKNSISTIGVDFKIKTIYDDTSIIKLQMWDTCGNERFQAITTSYYRGANGVIVVYDVTNRESFENVKKWIENVKRYSLENVNIILIGNKCDMVYNKKILFEEGKEYADSLGLTFFEASSKNNINIQNVFMDISKQIKKTTRKIKQQEPINIDLKGKTTNYDCCF